MPIISYSQLDRKVDQNPLSPHWLATGYSIHSESKLDSVIREKHYVDTLGNMATKLESLNRYEYLVCGRVWKRQLLTYSTGEIKERCYEYDYKDDLVEMITLTGDIVDFKEYAFNDDNKLVKAKTVYCNCLQSGDNGTQTQRSYSYTETGKISHYQYNYVFSPTFLYHEGTIIDEFFEYDENDFLVKMIKSDYDNQRPFDQETEIDTFTYEYLIENSLPVSIIVYKNSSFNRTHLYTYDSEKRLVRYQNGDFIFTDYTWQGDILIESVRTTYNSSNEEEHIRIDSYDSTGNLLRVYQIDPQTGVEHTNTYTYNSFGQLLESRDEDSAETTITKYFYSPVDKSSTDEDGDCYAAEDDCDDSNPDVNPSLEEVPYDGLDNDCDPTTKDDDLDGDGFLLAEDCNDRDSEINPSQVEVIYNGQDDDCNPTSRDDDLDMDGYNLVDDCDDLNGEINPDASEIVDNDIDEDCDGADGWIRSDVVCLERIFSTYRDIGERASSCDELPYIFSTRALIGESYLIMNPQGDVTYYVDVCSQIDIPEREIQINVLECRIEGSGFVYGADQVFEGCRASFSNRYLPAFPHMMVILSRKDKCQDFELVELGEFEFGCFNSDTTSVSDYQDIDLTVFPNPVKDEISIQHNSEKIFQYSIVDINGRILSETEESNINIGLLSNGVYFLQLKNSEGQLILTRRIIKI